MLFIIPIIFALGFLFSTIAVLFASQIGARVVEEQMKTTWIKQIFGLVLLFSAAKLFWSVSFQPQWNQRDEA